jgi:hypothetical protein
MGEYKQALIDRKVVETTAEFERWAAEKLGLEPGQMIVVNVDIRFMNLPLAKVGIKVRGMQTGRKYAKVTEDALTSEDWQKIFSLPTLNHSDTMVNTLRRFVRDNDWQPAGFDYKFYASVNTILRAAKVPYRLMSKGKGSWERKRVRMCRVVF